MSYRNTILIVDDDDQIRENVSQYLQEFNFKTIAAENGAIAFQKAIEQKPDLILCDIDMPNLDGYGLYKQIQQYPELSLTPFIFLTAKSTQEDFRKGLQLGADDYITKPFKLNDILITVNRRLEKISRLQEMSELKLKTIFDNELVGIFIYQDEGFIYANKKFKEIFNYKSAELKSLRFESLIAKSEQKANLEMLNACLEGAIKSTVIKTFIKSVKGKICAAISIHHLNINNKHTVIGILQPHEAQNQESDINLNQAYSNIVQQLKDQNQDELAKKLEELKNDLTPTDIEKNQRLKQSVSITKREKEVLELICQGFTNSEIADKLFISPRTVDQHRAHLLDKTNSKNTAQLVSYGVKHFDLNV